MTISAVLAPCSAHKRKLPTHLLEAARLPAGTQSVVARGWLDNVSTADGQISARDLYQGVSFSRLRQVADLHGCPLFVVSAGLGLLKGSTLAPAYDLTLSPSAPSRIQLHITDRFDPAAWWQQMQTGRFASSIDVLAVGEGRILVALTKPYAQLVGTALAQLTREAIKRLRIFGMSLEKSLPYALHAQVMPYDARLDALVPGTRLDFPSRALAHFAALIAAHPLQDVAGDGALVRAALAPITRPVSAMRSKASDEELLRQISALAQHGLSTTRALRELRLNLGIACEHGRFRRLYTMVSA